MEVVIACGGKGTRMQGLLKTIPKILAPVDNQVFLHMVLDYWENAGCEKVHLLLGVGASEVWNSVSEWKNRGDKNLNVSASIEPYALGVMGALKYGKSCLSDEFIFTYGDVYPSVNHSELLQSIKPGHGACLSVCENKYSNEPPNILLRGDNIVLYEKGNLTTTHLDVGMMVIRKDALKYLDNQSSFLNEVDLLSPLIREGKLGYYNHNRPSLHIGDPDAYNDFKKWNNFQQEEICLINN